MIAASAWPAVRPASMRACAAMLALGCATVNDRDQVIEQAVTALNCPASRIALRSDAPREYVTDGCGRRAGYVCGFSRIGIRSCRPADETPDPFRIDERVRAKAARLLSCASEDITVEEEVPDRPEAARFRALGCGRAVDYECASRVDCCAFVRPGVVAVDPETPKVAEPETDERAGGLPKRAIAGVIEASIGKVRACYEASLRTPPFRTGVVAVKFVIGPEGVVTGAAVARASLDDDATLHCIVEAVRSLRFPKPSDGGIVVVTYPFVLHTNRPYATCP